MTQRALVLGAGGPAASSWETGVIAGLANAGIDVRDCSLFNRPSSTNQEGAIIMTSNRIQSAAEIEVRAVIEAWAAATRQNRTDDVLKNHVPDLVIFDVLPPMQYESAESYRRSWDGWQPETQGEAKFDLENLSVTAGADVAFAHSLIRCGGSMPDGRAFEDLVRATFCLRKLDGSWKISHQHISKPLRQAGG